MECSRPLDDEPGASVAVWQHRPESRGYVRARSADPLEKPVIQPNYLADEMDRRVIVDGIKLARRLMRTEPLAPYFVEEALPGAEVRTDDQILDFARGIGTTAFHVAGTCRMGPATDRQAVVDDRLRVHGIEGLRVADASVMPLMTSANCNAAVLMIGEKAADMILDLPPAETAALP